MVSEEAPSVEYSNSSNVFCDGCGAELFNLGDYYWCEECGNCGICYKSVFGKLPEGLTEIEVIDMLPEDAYGYC